MPIIYDEKKRVFKLDTPNTTYAFHVTNSNHLLHLYYGATLPVFIHEVSPIRLGEARA